MGALYGKRVPGGWILGGDGRIYYWDPNTATWRAKVTTPRNRYKEPGGRRVPVDPQRDG